MALCKCRVHVDLINFYIAKHFPPELQLTPPSCRVITISFCNTDVFNEWALMKWYLQRKELVQGTKRLAAVKSVSITRPEGLREEILLKSWSQKSIIKHGNIYSQRWNAEAGRAWTRNALTSTPSHPPLPYQCLPLVNPASQRQETPGSSSQKGQPQATRQDKEEGQATDWAVQPIEKNQHNI